LYNKPNNINEKEITMNKIELVVIAKELNKVVNCDPPINIKGSAEVITAGIIEAEEIIEYETDKFSDDTIKGMIELGCWKGAEPKEEKEEAEVPEEKEAEAEAPVKTKKGKKAKAEVPEEEAEAPVEKEKKEETKKVVVKKMSRVDAICNTIKGLKEEVTKAELNILSNTMYAENGGKSNEGENMYVVVKVLPTLANFEIEVLVK